MKSLIAVLLIAGATSFANASSTDTIKDVDNKIKAVDAAIASDMSAIATQLTPAHRVEERIVELHITEVEEAVPAKQKVKHHKENFAAHALCSGAFIDAIGDIITARHCTEGAASIDVVTYDNREYRAVIAATSTTHDLALLHIDRLNTQYFSPAPEVKRGETIYILGSPLGISDTLNTGIVAKLGGDETLLDCSVLPGNSGSTVFDENQDLVGVATAGFIVILGTTHLNIAQGVDAVEFFIAEALAKRNKQ